MDYTKLSENDDDLFVEDREFQTNKNLPAFLNVEAKETGDILVFFKRPSEMRWGHRYATELLGVEIHTFLSCQNYAHCEIHFVQSDVGVCSALDTNGVFLMYNKEYKDEEYDLVYRVKMSSVRYNHLLGWAINKASGDYTYDMDYMYFYCLFFACRCCLTQYTSADRLDTYTCASLCYSMLAVAGFTDLRDPNAKKEDRNARREEMKLNRNVLTEDVRVLLENTQKGLYAKSKDIILVQELNDIPYKLKKTPQQ